MTTKIDCGVIFSSLENAFHGGFDYLPPPFFSLKGFAGWQQLSGARYEHFRPVWRCIGRIVRVGAAPVLQGLLDQSAHAFGAFRAEAAAERTGQEEGRGGH